MKITGYNILPDSIAVSVDELDDPIIVQASEANHDELLEAIRSLDHDRAITALTPSLAIQKASGDKVSVSGDKVFYEDTKLDNVIVEKIASLAWGGEKFDAIVNFLERLMENPSMRAREELSLFLRTNGFPLLSSGHFLAYRNVDENYMSYHVNPDGSRNKNRIGDEVSMDRKFVDDDRNSTCSAGLHFCSKHYLSQYYGGSGHTMIVKIDPKDVVSIPIDYNNAKGRCCAYTVIGEVNYQDVQNATTDPLLKKQVFDEHSLNDLGDDDENFGYLEEELAEYFGLKI